MPTCKNSAAIFHPNASVTLTLMFVLFSFSKHKGLVRQQEVDMEFEDFIHVVSDPDEARQFLRRLDLLRSNPPGKAKCLT